MIKKETKELVIPELVVTISEKVQDKIDEILDNLDFEKINGVMESLNWCWGSETTTPSVRELRIYVRDTLKRVYREAVRGNHQSWGVYSGGFEIRYYTGIDSDGPWENFEVKFIVEAWHTEG